LRVANRDAAVAEAAELSDDHRRRCSGVFCEHRGDLAPEGVEDRAPVATLVARWILRVQEPGDGVSAHPEAPGDAALREPMALMKTVDLGPVMH
jgi:hypothetical protein